MGEVDAETPTLEAYRIMITYGFDVDGDEYITFEPDSPISTILLLGILEHAKYRVLHPDFEDKED